MTAKYVCFPCTRRYTISSSLMWYLFYLYIDKSIQTSFVVMSCTRMPWGVTFNETFFNFFPSALAWNRQSYIGSYTMNHLRMEIKALHGMIPHHWNTISPKNVCFVLRFYYPVNPMGSCQAWSVYLTTLLLDRLSPLSCLPVLWTFFCQKNFEHKSFWQKKYIQTVQTQLRLLLKYFKK